MRRKCVSESVSKWQHALVGHEALGADGEGGGERGEELAEVDAPRRLDDNVPDYEEDKNVSEWCA